MGRELAHETGLAGRYATALFELATEAKAVESAAEAAALKQTAVG